VKFFFKEFGAAIGIPHVFRRIAACVHLQSYCSALKGSAELHHALPV
jgi:hypothetical protein